jgi:hypothetical protein
VAANDRYVFVSTAPANAPAQNLLIDRRTGRRHRLTLPAGCSPTGAVFQGPWLVLCSGGYGAALYDLSSGRWSLVQANDSIQGQCSAHDGYTPVPECMFVAAGTRWVEFEIVRFCDGCADSLILQSLLDPQATMSDPAVPGGRRIADLNAPSGIQTLCRPLRVTQGGGFELRDPSAFAFYGGFAMVWGVGHATLERCGSHLRYPLPLIVRTGRSFSVGYWRAGRALVAWQVRSRRIGGLFLPSLRRFTIALPGGATARLAAISRRTVYVLDSGAPGQPGDLWAAIL